MHPDRASVPLHLQEANGVGQGWSTQSVVSSC